MSIVSTITPITLSGSTYFMDGTGLIVDGTGLIIGGQSGIGTWGGRGKDRKPRKPRTPTRRPDPFLPNIFVTNRRTGRTKTYHSSLETTAFLWGKDLNDFIIVKDIPLGTPGSRIAFQVLPTTNDLHDLQIQLDTII